MKPPPRLLILMALLLLCAPAAALGHPGRTAADGCHYCRTHCDSWGVPWNERHCHGGGSLVPDPDDQNAGSGGYDAAWLSTIVSVVDGDTIKVNTGQDLETVRLIGIDTPETVHPSKPVECFGKEASARLAELLEVGEAVILEKDAIGDTIDKYGRLLRYVIVDGKTDINARMVEEGYAYAYTTYPFDRSAEYVALEAQAKAAGRGLWAPGACDVPAWEVSTPSPAPSEGSTTSSTNDPTAPAPASSATQPPAEELSEPSASAAVIAMAVLVTPPALLFWLIRRFLKRRRASR